MTAHTHKTYEAGCHRCSLGMDEAVGSLQIALSEVEAALKAERALSDRLAAAVCTTHQCSDSKDARAALKSWRESRGR